MTIKISLLTAFIAAACVMNLFAKVSSREMRWRDLPPLPVAIAGQFVGADRERLLVAGGTAWTKAPWDGGQKIWTDRVQMLTPGASRWREVGRLPKPLAYGATLSTPEGMILIGGQTANETSASVFRLRIQDDQLVIASLPDLPTALTNHGAALLNGIVYVIGGQTTTNALSASGAVWTLDLKHSQAGWKRVADLPGAGRILPVVAADGEAVYVLSGAELYRGEDGSTKRRYLSDVYRCKAGEGWRRMKDLDSPVVAASALHLKDDLLIFSGDDGAHASRVLELKDNHPGFLRTVLAYRVGNLKVVGAMPLSLVTTGAVIWQKQIVIAGGEDRPGHRSARVIATGLP